MIQRGEVWWADLDEPRGSGPEYRRPVLVVQADAFNRSRIETVIVVILTSNVKLLEAPGNVLVPKRTSRLVKDAIVNVSQIVTLDRKLLVERVTKLPSEIVSAVERGLRLVLSL